MTTIVNSPTPNNGDSGGAGTGLIIAVIAIVAAILIGLFFVYALPELRRMGAQEDNGTDINIPDQVDINLNNDQGGDEGGGESQ